MTNLPPAQPDQFIPLRTFMSRMPQSENFPYATVLSFAPLLDYLKSRGAKLSTVA